MWESNGRDGTGPYKVTGEEERTACEKGGKIRPQRSLGEYSASVMCYGVGMLASRAEDRHSAHPHGHPESTKTEM